jgi:hypothetical protein
MGSRVHSLVQKIIYLSCGLVVGDDGSRRYVRVPFLGAVELLEKAIGVMSAEASDSDSLFWLEEMLRRRVGGLYFIAGQFDKSISHYTAIHSKRVFSKVYQGLETDIALISICLGK